MKLPKDCRKVRWIVAGLVVFDGFFGAGNAFIASEELIEGEWLFAVLPLVVAACLSYSLAQVAELVWNDPAVFCEWDDTVAGTDALYRERLISVVAVRDEEGDPLLHWKWSGQAKVRCKHCRRVALRAAEITEVRPVDESWKGPQ